MERFFSFLDGFSNNSKFLAHNVHDAMENAKEPLQRAIDAFNSNNVRSIASQIRTATKKINILRDALKEYTKYRSETIGYDDLEIREEDIKAIEAFMSDAKIKLQSYRETMRGRKNKGAISMSESKLEKFASVFEKFENELNDAMEASKQYKKGETYRSQNKEKVFNIENQIIKESLLSASIYKVNCGLIKQIVDKVVKSINPLLARNFISKFDNRTELINLLSESRSCDAHALLSIVHLYQKNADPWGFSFTPLKKAIKQTLPAEEDPFDNIDVEAFKRDVSEAFMQTYNEDIDIVPTKKPSAFKNKVADFLIVAFMSMFDFLRNGFKEIIVSDDGATFNYKNKFFDFIVNKCGFNSVPTTRTFYNIWNNIKATLSATSFRAQAIIQDEIDRINQIMSFICRTPFFSKPIFKRK